MKRLLISRLPLLIACILLHSNATYPQDNEESNSVDVKDRLEHARELHIQHKFDSSLLVYKNLSHVLSSEENWEYKLEAILNIADIYKTFKDYELSRKYLDSAYHIVIGEKQLLVIPKYLDILYQYSSIYISLRKFDSANYYLYKALEFKDNNKETVDDTLLASIYNNLGTINWYQRQFEDALNNYEIALSLAQRKQNPINEQSGSSYQNMGLVYIFLGDYDEAEKHLKESLEIKKQTSGESSYSIARAYLNLGNFYNSISKVELAYELFQKAEEIYLNLFGGDYLELGHVYWDMANYYITIGDYDNAILHLDKALSIFEKNKLESENDILSVKMNLGYIYEKQGKISKAIQYYASSMETNNLPTIIKAERNLGNLYSRIDSNNLAKEYYSRSIKNSVELYGKYSHDLGLSYLYYGELLAKIGDYSQGIKYINKSLEIFKEIFGENNRDVSRVQIKIGDIYFEQDEYELAIKNYEESIENLINKAGIEFTPNYLKKHAVIDRVYIEAISKMANTYLRLYSQEEDVSKLETAYQLFIICSEIIVKLNDVYTDEESKLLLANEAKEIYNRLVYIAISLFKNTSDSTFLSESFYYSERSKSSVLLATIKDIEAKTLGNIPDELRTREKDLRLNINSYSRLMYEENNRANPDNDKINLWRSKVFESKQKLDSLVAYFEVNYPSYFYFKYNYDFIEPTSVQNKIDEDVTFINYVLFDTLLISYTINKENIAYYITTFNKKELTESLNYVSDFFNNEGFIDIDSSSYSSFIKHSNYLYNILIGPLDKSLLNKRLVIIPDAELNHLSFDLLLVSTPQKSIIDFRSLDYFLKHHIVSYSSSATLLFDETKDKVGKNSKVLAFSPKYEWNTYIDSSDTRNIAYANLTPLPHAKEEVERIFKFAAGKMFLDETATEENFIDNAKDYSILHLAMHTIINDENPMYSKLAFYNDPNNENDGFLNTYEIYNLELNGKLAVLSACNTGTGKLEKGEGVMNLARAFFYAGIPSVIMTLWTVDDESSSEIINNFYSNLQKGEEIDAALNRAKLDFISNSSPLKAHPYYWAGYVPIGKTESLVIKDSSNLLLYIILIIAAVISVTFILYIKRRRN